eukprot:CAMPEP_0197055806 /NCGR_PEP_ID=MMETSP1384-20130603/73992_1 /TAXON_ID=29189 /ORGANISM="Ammonia sp." /LENGTH=383 /DNA_ID=CAMNT_0042489525 /DNA_START=17 /DNA_END=1168 /DNA_ORIENTATION=+
MDAQRELLDALMGKGRNRSKEDAPLKEQHWDDADVCPYFICAFCPHDLFVNTKSDLGPCEYVHVEDLKEEYNKQPRRVKRRLEKRLLQYLYELVADVDRRIRRGKERIALNAPSTQPNPILEQQIEQKKKSIKLRCDQLDAEINKLKEHIETLCDQGKIDDAESMLKQVETLEADKDNLQNMDVNHVGVKDPRSDKNRFQICEICGVFQAVDDAEDRIARHFEGKQHKGFDVIRQKIKELEALHTAELHDIQQRDDHRGGHGRSRERSRHRDASDSSSSGRRSRRSGKSSRDRDRDRERARGRKSSSSSRHREDRKHTHRSSRHRRDDKRSRERSGSRSRSRSRRRDKESAARRQPADDLDAGQENVNIERKAKNEEKMESGE